MNFQDVFNEFFVQYRGDAEIPPVGDDEWNIAIQLCNQAIRRWDRVDGVLWKELYSTLGEADDGDSIVITGQTEYEAPSNLRKPGGYIFVGGKRVQLLEPALAQRMNTQSGFAYFTGNPNAGFTLHLNPAPTAANSGQAMDYVYYKKPVTLETTEGGTTEIDMNDPNFAVQHMLASRFRASRNWPAYQTAARDADIALKDMVTDNTAGTDTSNFTLIDSTPIGS